MIFIISLVLIWVFSITVLIVDYKSEANRWISSAAFFVGLRYLADGINTLIVPNAKNYFSNATLAVSNLRLSVCILTSISFLFYPYTLLMFSLSFTKLLGARKKRLLMWLLLIPIIISYVLLPINDFMYPTTKPSYKYLTIWSTFGIISANLILIISYFRTMSISKKRDIFLVSAFLMPTTLFGWDINFLLPILGVKNLWRFNILVVLLVATLYCLLVTKFGFLGIKIRFEKNRLASTMQSISSGTQILTHAIKNEVLKISLCTRNINSAETAIDKEIFDRYIGDNSKNIMASTEHLIMLVSRIKEYMHEIKIHEEYHNLSDIIEDSLNLMAVYIKEKDITIKRNYSYGQFGIILSCDAVHIQEVLNNILKNSIEALQHGGEIRIQVVKNRKYLTVEIRDNGAGIPNSNLSRVFDPFFSTKKTGLNFGLGLSYCYNVMQKHGGEIEIESVENKGTTVILKFLSKKVRKAYAENV